MTVMVERAEERGEHGQEGRHQADLFYTENDIVALADPCWLQGAFITMVGLFDRVGLQTNVSKAVGIVFRP